MHHHLNLRKSESHVSGQFRAPSQAEGVDLDELPVGTTLEVETGHTRYLLENLGDGKVLITGHPDYCPEPVEVEFQGSIGGPAVLKMWHIEPGMKMAFQHPRFGMVRTSRVRSVRELKAGVPS